MKVEFHRATLEDANTIGDITARSWQAGYRDIVPDDYLSRITPEFRAERFRAVYPLLPDAEYYLVFVGGKPVGAFNLQPCIDEDRKSCGQIGIFYFLPEAWGTGSAAETMRFALDRLRALGFTHVVVWVLEENARARRFYDKCGFLEDGAKKTVNLGKPLIEIRYVVEL